MIEILAHARDHAKGYKGMPVVCRDAAELAQGVEWGGRERPPDYVVIRVTDAEKADLPAGFLGREYNDFETAPTANKNEYTVRMKPAVVAKYAGKTAAKVTDGMVNVLSDLYGAVKRAGKADQSDATLQFGRDIEREEVDQIMRDRWRVSLYKRRFAFASNVIDQALAEKGGVLVTNKASGVLIGSVIDRLG